MYYLTVSTSERFKYVYPEISIMIPIHGEIPPNRFAECKGKLIYASSATQSLVGKVRDVDLTESLFVMDGVPWQDYGTQKVELIDNVLLPLAGLLVTPISHDYYGQHVRDIGRTFQLLGHYVQLGDDAIGKLKYVTSQGYLLNPGVRRFQAGLVRLPRDTYVSGGPSVRAIEVGEDYFRNVLKESKQDAEMLRLERKVKLLSLRHAVKNMQRKPTQKKK